MIERVNFNLLIMEEVIVVLDVYVGGSLFIYVY